MYLPSSYLWAFVKQSIFKTQGRVLSNRMSGNVFAGFILQILWRFFLQFCQLIAVQR